MSKAGVEKQIRKAGKGKWLLLPIENKTREFDAELFLACLAAERGYKVLIGHYSAFRTWLRCFPKGMILEKCISINKEELMRRFLSYGHRICVSDEEGLSVFLDPDAFVRTRVNETTLDMADYMFSWGDGEAKVVQDAFPDYAHKVLATGTPRVDLWRPELRGLYADKVAEIHERYGRYILLPSNFSGVIFISGAESIIEQARKYGYFRDGDDEQALRDEIEHVAANLELFVKSFRKIRDAFPDHALIIRPHPTDDHRYWNKAVEGIDNAHVVYEGGVTPWLMGAEAIFHHGCTTGIESRILGRCAVAYHPIWNSRFDKHPSTAVGPVVKDENELIDFLKTAVANEGVCALKEGEVDEFMQSTFGPFASERIIDALDDLEWQEDHMDLAWSNSSAAVVRAHEGFRRFRKWLRHPFIRNTAKYQLKQDRTRQKWSGTSVPEINSIAGEFGKLTGRFGNVKAQQVSDDIFYLTGD